MELIIGARRALSIYENGFVLSHYAMRPALCAMRFFA
jgi:hypothetical protein